MCFSQRPMPRASPSGLECSMSPPAALPRGTGRPMPRACPSGAGLLNAAQEHELRSKLSIRRSNSPACARCLKMRHATNREVTLNVKSEDRCLCFSQRPMPRASPSGLECSMSPPAALPPGTGRPMPRACPSGAGLLNAAQGEAPQRASYPWRNNARADCTADEWSSPLPDMHCKQLP